MKNSEIIEILNEDKKEIIESGFIPEFYRSSFRGKELVILSAQVSNKESVYRKTIREIQFNTKEGADKLFKELK